MSEQPQLFDAPAPLRTVTEQIRVVTSGVSRHDSIQAQFEEFHAANPWVYNVLRKLALDLVAHGRRRIGIGMLFEVMRWHHHLSTVDPDSDFKLNNNYRSRYARLLMAQEPELVDVFEIRGLRAAEA